MILPCLSDGFPARLALVAALLVLGGGLLWAADSYQSLYQSMQARQSRLEDYLLDPGGYLGEGLDGLLEINANCPSEARNLAEAENRDRESLNRLMATDLGSSPEEVGRDYARRYGDRYRAGVLRQIRLASGEVTWWNGIPPDPRKSDAPDVPRVLSLHGATIYQRPDKGSRPVRSHVDQYEGFWVLDSTTEAAGQRWYQVTERFVPKQRPADWRQPNDAGWIAADQCIPWRRALAMKFTDLVGRDYKRSLFFDPPEPVIDLMKEDPATRARRLNDIRTRFREGDAVDGVVAMEPQVGKGQKRVVFYPVLDFYQRAHGEKLRIDGKSARLLQVAARTRAGGADGYDPERSAVPMDLVFVMDTTNSMKPYLENVKAATEELARTSGDDALRFGFIGYRDKKSKGFEYEVEEFTRRTQPVAEFAKTLKRVKARPGALKNDDIPESVFEAIDKALQSNQWRPADEAVRVIFLVGDAPGHKGALDAAGLRDKARARNIRIYAFHIKNSKVSKRFDRQSRRQYQVLSSYFPVAPGTSEKIYLTAIDAGTARFRQEVLDSFRDAVASLDHVRESLRTGKQLPAVKPGSLSELIFQQAVLLMPSNSMPQEDVQGWVSDKVLTNPDREALAPMILLTEVELTRLRDHVKELEEIGERARRGEGGTTLDFFDLVDRNTRFTMINPSAATFRDAFAIPLGMDQLPYKSDIMALTRQDFHNPDRVEDFMRALRHKLRYYDGLLASRADPEIWKKLSARADREDEVVGVELYQLP
jgi:hypothetical protein